MGRHAYLIIVHNEFEVLRKLAEALDDVRNDIYIHFDSRIGTIPEIRTKFSRVFYTDRRIDVHWGDISLVKVEFILWEAARRNGPYEYYHMISGTHFPLKSQDQLHDFFDCADGMSVISYMDTNPYEIDIKLCRYNFFTKNYICDSRFLQTFSQIMWRICLRIQILLHYSRKRTTVFVKASQWLSLTEEAVDYMLSIKDTVLEKYRYTFCSDEFFVPTELEASPLKSRIKDCQKMLKCRFSRANTVFFSLDDFDDIVASDCLFARKFTAVDLGIVEKLRGSWER